MRAFLELVENIRSKGLVETIFDPADVAEGSPDGNELRRQRKIREFKPHQVTDKLWKQLEVCQPFVFMEPLSLDEELNWSKRTQEDTIDAPFASCSIETLNVGGLLGCDVPYARAEEQSNHLNKIKCVFGAETSPRVFDILVLIYYSSGPRVLYTTNGNIHYGHVMSQYFQRLKTHAVGYEPVRERTILGTGANKRVHRLRKIVHVIPKKLRESYEAQHRSVDWSHRWLVRGHWVSLPGRLGKDRHGDYCVQDWTWRSEHEKGPENAPLINKTRFVGSVTQTVEKETK